MCGLHWYKQELEKAEGDNKKLEQLKQMLEQRFNITENLPSEHKASVEIMSLYNEIIHRKV